MNSVVLSYGFNNFVMTMKISNSLRIWD